MNAPTAQRAAAVRTLAAPGAQRTVSVRTLCEFTAKAGDLDRLVVVLVRILVTFLLPHFGWWRGLAISQPTVGRYC